MPVLMVSYEDTPEFSSDLNFDERLENLLEKESSGSGFGCARDIDWRYRSYNEARKAARKVRAYLKKEKGAVYRNAKVKVVASV
ncbi:MAG: hypothetical protein GF334_04505 [Candidatus Altiarchaeales archaeon]|nr:hypothetical protein [Candidatus Altiarchaeales archaeon]